MKPFILPTPPVVDGKITLTPDQLDSLIERAYNAGYTDGKHSPSYFDMPYYRWFDTNPRVMPCGDEITHTLNPEDLKTYNIAVDNMTTYTWAPEEPKVVG